MITVKQGQSGKTGVDVFDWQQMSHVKPEGYVVAHMLGIATRAQRRRMYFCMLKQALWAQNDELAEFAFKKCILFLNRKKETMSEQDYWNKGAYPSLWSVEKEVEHIALQYRVVRFCRALLERGGVYKQVPSERSFGSGYAVIHLPKTWRIVVQEVAGIFRTSFHGGSDWGLPAEEKLIDNAYNLLYDIYTNKTTERALRSVTLPFFVNLPSSERDVLDMFRNAINSMPLRQVVFFLERYPSMPREWLHLFRIEFVRKGGAIDMKAEPLKYP